MEALTLPDNKFIPHYFRSPIKSSHYVVPNIIYSVPLRTLFSIHKGPKRVVRVLDSDERFSRNLLMFLLASAREGISQND